MSNLVRALTGYDVFVSYARSDASAYAASLVERLRNQGLACFLDREEAALGSPLNETLKRSLDQSRTLVLICSKHACQSSYVQSEVRHFKKNGRPILVIDVDGRLGESPWRSLGKRIYADESSDALTAGEPSSAVLAAIAASFRLAKRSTIRKALVALFVLLAGTVVATVGWALSSWDKTDLADQARHSLHEGYRQLNIGQDPTKHLVMSVKIYGQLLRGDKTNEEYINGAIDANMGLAASDSRKRRAYVDQAVGHAGSNPRALARIAFELAESRQPDLRDGRRALELAQQCHRLVGGDDAGCLQAMGAAHAELKNFESAVNAQRKALNLTMSENQRSEAQERLKSYEAKKQQRSRSFKPRGTRTSK